MSKVGFVLVIAACFIIGCAQSPSKIRSPMVTFAYDEAANPEKPGTIMVSARVYNDNDSVAFIGYQADLVLKVEGEVLIRDRSKSVDIYPFNAAGLIVEKQLSKDEFIKIAKKLAVSTEDIDRLKEAQPVFLSDSQLALANIKCTQLKMSDFLKGSKK
jgi:hypothetical protein